MALSSCSGPAPCGPNASGLCVDSRSIYGVTNNRDQVHPNAETRAEQKKAIKLLNSSPSASDQLPNIDGGAAPPVGTPQANDQSGAATAGGVSASTVGQMGNYGAALNMPQPILTQPVVMRVWIAPWIDDQGDLHWPGYSFLVVKREQWRFGTQAVKQSDVLTPVQVAPAVGMSTYSSRQSGDSVPPPPPVPVTQPNGSP